MGIESRLQRAAAIIVLRVTSHCDYRNALVFCAAPQRLCQFITIHFRHADIRDDDIERSFMRQSQSGGWLNFRGPPLNRVAWVKTAHSPLLTAVIVRQDT